MKIAMVCLHASPTSALLTGDGAAGEVASLSAALARVGHEVTVFTRDDGAAPEPHVRTASGVDVVHVSAGERRPLGDDDVLRLMPEVGAVLAGRWSADPPDVVHAHGWLSGLPSLAATRGTSVPVVLSLPSLALASGTTEPARESRVRLERALTHSASHLVAHSDHQRDDLVRLGADRWAVSVVPWGVDGTQFDAAGPVAPRGSVPRALHVGSLAAHRGVDDVLAALCKVPHAELVLAGGPCATALEEDPDVARVRALADRLGLAGRVDVRGYVPRTELPALIRSADLLVSAPRDAPFGSAALEAMSCGVPVVAVDAGGLGELVVDGATGVLVPPRDTDALAYALRDLLRDPVRREGYGVAAVDRARARYGWDRVAADSLAVYSRVVPQEEAGETGESEEDDPLEDGAETVAGLTES